MYEHRYTNLLTYQLNVPIKNGNSGGPVLKDNRLVGVAFESGANEDNKDVGFIIPTPVINQFLADIADGKNDGIPSLGITLQAIENPDLKLKLGMAENQSGDLVIKIDPDSPAKGILKQSDVILSIKHKAIVGDKTVEFPEIIAASSLDTIKRSQINDTVIIQILRNKTIMHTKVRLSEPWPISKLVSPEQYDIEPTYFIFGGLVFEPLTVNFLKTWGSNWLLEAPSNLLNYLLYGKRRYNRKEIIVLVKVLSDEINVSYEGFEDCVISSVNNKQISTMRDLVKAFQEHRGEYHTITDEFGHKIVLDRKKVNRRGKKILKKYGIGSDRSSDLE